MIIIIDVDYQTIIQDYQTILYYTILVLPMHHLNVLLKDPIYRNLYFTHRPSTGITMLYVTVIVLMFAMKASISEIP